MREGKGKVFGLSSMIITKSPLGDLGANEAEGAEEAEEAKAEAKAEAETKAKENRF